MSNTSLTPTIFHEDWWLNIATSGRYAVAEVKNGNQVVGRLPYVVGKRMGLSWSDLPTLTHFLGPAVDEGTGSLNKRFINRLEITRELIKQLPRLHFMQLKCHRQVLDVIPFQEQRYKTSVQFTHEIPPTPKDTLWSCLRHERRRVITRAEEQLRISRVDDIDAFTRFYQANLVAQGIKGKIDLSVAAKLIEACRTRQRGELLGAYDDKGTLQAAIFCNWDETARYYLMTTRSTTSGNGAVSALIWRAMQDAAAQNQIFDLDGLSDIGSIMFFAGFGGIVRPRYVATHRSLPVYMLHGLTRNSNEKYWFI